MSRLTLVAFVACASASLEDAEAYLLAQGIPSGLPALKVKYPRGSWGGKLRVEGASTNVKVREVDSKPEITWDPENAPDRNKNKYVLMMLGPDEPQRKSAGSAGISGPVLHYLGVNCDDKAESCYDAVKHEGPSPQANTGTHRYIWILFKQTAPLPSMQILNEFLQVDTRANWRFAEFVKAVGDSMAPHSVNFFYASQEGPDSEPNPPTPTSPESNVLKMKPPRASIPAPSMTPLGPQWAKKPTHDEL